MKKSNVFIALAVTIILAASSIGVVFAAQAHTSTATTTQGAINFTAPSGIRWNEGMQVFEVFNYTGVSAMGSGQYVNATGDISATAFAGAVQATYQANYNIMKDIPYDANATVYNHNIEVEVGVWESHSFKTRAPNFGTNIATTGIIDGRGFTFKNFPNRGGLGLYYNFYGTLRNLNVDFGFVAAVGLYGLFYTNFGRIENCTTLGSGVSDEENTAFLPFGFANQSTGEVKNCTNYFSAMLTGAASVATGFVFYSHGLITNCTNQADLQAARVTGIVVFTRLETTSRILNCTNNGAITSIDSSDIAITRNIAAGIVYAPVLGNYVVRGCVNNGKVEALHPTKGVACGIIAAPNDGTILLDNLTNSYNNTNNGEVSGAPGKTYTLYYGKTTTNRD